MTEPRTMSEARKTLAAALDCQDHVPDVIDPPTVVIGPGDPPIAPGDTFVLADAVMNLEVYVLVEITDGATMLEQVEQALPTVLAVVAVQGWDIGTISRPDVFETADWSAYGVQVNISRPLSLEAMATPVVPSFILPDPDPVD